MTGPAHNVASVADFLHRALVAGAIDVTQLEAMARAAGLLGKRQQIQHAKAFKKAKRSLGIRSIREGFGSTGKWAWLLPPKPVKPANKEADRTRDATTREQAHSVIVNLNGLPAELLSGRIPPHWIRWNRSPRKPSSTKGSSCASVASIHQRLPHIPPG